MKNRRKMGGQRYRTCYLFFVILLKIFVLLYGIDFFSDRVPYLGWILRGVAFFCVVWILNTGREPSYKICWLLLILPFPEVGVCLFFSLGEGGKKMKERLRIMGEREKEGRLLEKMWGEEREFLGGVSEEEERQVFYFRNTLECLPYIRSGVKYFSAGEDLFCAMKSALGKAEKYIFLEYFIVNQGVFWGEILDILREKCIEGVEVRLLYDDVGCLFFLPEDFSRKMGEMGIKAKGVHPLGLRMWGKENLRDHRKLMIVDGVVGFTGGVNLSDEYVTGWSSLGRWKDSAILLEGQAVWSITLTFLVMWEYVTGGQENFMWYFPKKSPVFQETSVILPYTEVPLDGEPVAQRVFLNMILGAKEYVYITSPYLILDAVTEMVLCNMAKMGVDVKIITPRVPDKKLVFQVTRGQYGVLMESGVQIYEYLPGFLHGKNVVVDGKFATVGTVNLDYRSLFLHFENGVWISGGAVVQEIEEDFSRVLEESELYEEKMERFLWVKKVLRSVLRVFSPLM